MARKYDRYGLNRQFKAKPCSKLYPFPYPLPFIDDYSAANVLEKASAELDTPSGPAGTTPGMYYPPTTGKRSREQVEEQHAKRRKSNASRKLRFPDPLGKDVYTWSRKDTEFALMAASAPFAPLAFEALQMVGARSAVAKARRIPKKKFIRGKIPDAIRTGLRRGRKIARFLRSQKRGPRLMRAGVRFAAKKLL
jgi:hypothetical protein